MESTNKPRRELDAAKALIRQAFPNMLAGYRAGIKEHSGVEVISKDLKLNRGPIEQWLLDWLKGARDLGIYKGPISVDIEFVREDWE